MPTVTVKAVPAVFSFRFSRATASVFAVGGQCHLLNTRGGLWMAVLFEWPCLHVLFLFYFNILLLVPCLQRSGKRQALHVTVPPARLASHTASEVYPLGYFAPCTALFINTWYDTLWAVMWQMGQQLFLRERKNHVCMSTCKQDHHVHARAWSMWRAAVLTFKIAALHNYSIWILL